MDLDTWLKKASAKKYAHFDVRKSIESVFSYVSNPDKVSKHAFYPFISFEKSIKKLAVKHGRVRILPPKTRPLCYSAHLDRYIYQYYGLLINDNYKSYIRKNEFHSSVLAYRDDLHESNIHFAKRAFDFIKKGNSTIVVGDFSSFFDNLNHKYLKKMLCRVLGVQALSSDFYAVFKSITQYSKWELSSLLKINGYDDSIAGYKRLNRQYTVLSKKKFRGNTKEITPKNRVKGIPQGSAISAVLSNVYMIDFDKELFSFVQNYNGLYLRYSDDFIIILPYVYSEFLVKGVMSKIENLIESVFLELQPNKTHVYNYNGHEILEKIIHPKGIPQKDQKGKIDYLGFVFDGKKVSMREKTISGYYRRLHRKLKTVLKHVSGGKIVSCRILYAKYSDKGRRPIKEDGKYKSRGNFLTYARKAEHIFGNEENIGKQVRRHFLKIRRKRESI